MEKMITDGASAGCKEQGTSAINAEQAGKNGNPVPQGQGPGNSSPPQLPGLSDEEKSNLIRAKIAAGSAHGGRSAVISIKRLRPHPLAEGFFPIDDATLGAVTESMKTEGYDHSRPLTIVDVKDDEYKYVIEGLTRLAAAKEAGIEYIPVVRMNLETDEDILLYIVESQICRRNCSDAVLLKAAETIIPIEEKRARERQGKSASAQGWAEGWMPSSKAVGQILHISKSSVDKIKAVVKNDDSRRKVVNDGLSINRAYEELMSGRRKSKAQLNPAPLDNSVKPTKPKDSAVMVVPKDNIQEAANPNIAECSAECGHAAAGDLAKQEVDQKAGGNSQNTDALASDGNLSCELPDPVMRLLIAMAAWIPDDAKPEIRELLAACDAKISAVLWQHLENKTETNPSRIQSRKNPAEELTFRKGNRRQQQRNENVKADTST